jgi:cell envelope opacity-associated protein A
MAPARHPRDQRVIAPEIVQAGESYRSTSVPSAAAIQAAQAKWDAFKAARGGTTVQFTEQEVTSRG